MQFCEHEYEIINKYINTNFCNINSLNDALIKFKDLNDFFYEYNINATPDLLIELINNNDFFIESIKLIFNKYKKYIIDDKSNELFDNKLLVSIVEIYCMINNIDLKRNDDIIGNIDSLPDSIKLYFKEIANHPLLTLEEEKKLGIKILNGDMAARDKLIECNLKLVVKFANKYLYSGMPFQDMIQDGNIGLINAVDNYDPYKGYKFSTYAYYWIRQNILRSISNKGRNIRLPVHLTERLDLFKKTLYDLEKKLNREPSLEEIADEMKIPFKIAEQLYKLRIDTISMSTTISDEGDTELGEFLVSDDLTPEELLIGKSLPEEIQKLFVKCKLTKREIDVLMARNGFYNDDVMTLESVGKKYNITRERVRQIELRALNKIRSSNYIYEFVDYMQNPTKSETYIESFKEKKFKTKQNQVVELKPKKGRSLYKYFKDYTKEEVDYALTKLTDEEFEIVSKRYGGDFLGA
ncbi:MAG: sigma-70 family RNA polymerase sigma factor, partial [bacterium]|nr:sigma-70 family RNA polymerase sigma factor [bacterium]